MTLMEPLSVAIKDKQYYVTVLDTCIVENDIALKHRLQKADTYSQFVNEQAGILMDQTGDYISENEVSFSEALSEVVGNWKQRMFS